MTGGSVISGKTLPFTQTPITVFGALARHIAGLQCILFKIPKSQKIQYGSVKRKLDICERHIRVCETVFSSAEDRRLFVCYPAWSRGAISNANTECHGQKQPKTRICKICAKICLGMWMPCFSLPTRDFVVLSWVLSHAPAVMPLLLSPSSCPPAPPLPPAECQINWSRVLLLCGLMLILRHKYFWLLSDFILWQIIMWDD